MYGFNFFFQRVISVKLLSRYMRQNLWYIPFIDAFEEWEMLGLSTPMCDFGSYWYLIEWESSQINILLHQSPLNQIFYYFNQTWKKHYSCNSLLIYKCTNRLYVGNITRYKKTYIWYFAHHWSTFANKVTSLRCVA